MKHFSTPQLETSFVRPGVPMFSDLIESIHKADDLRPSRRRDMVSGLRRIAKALGRHVNDVPADTRWLQPRLSSVHPASLGLSKKAWQNAVSDTRAAMSYLGLVRVRKNDITQLAPEWRELWERVLAAKDLTLQPPLCRFVHFLSRNGIRPDQVAHAAALAYREALALNEISKDPEVTYRAAVNGWNLAIRRIPGWPANVIQLPSRQKRITLPLHVFPASLAADLEDLLRLLAGNDLLAAFAPAKALRPSTLAQYRRLLTRFASELVHGGVPPGDLVDVRTMLDPQRVEHGLRKMLARTGNKKTVLISHTAMLLHHIAKVLQVSEGQQKQLASLVSRVTAGKRIEMTAKNRSRLSMLQDPRRQRRLLLLPDRLFERARHGKAEFSWALMREDALAIAILLVCPIRVRNLSEIHIERNLRRPGDGRVILSFGENETKTSRPIEFELPRDVLRLLERHLATRSPALCPRGTPWLFPRRDGRGSVSPIQLSNRLTRRIRNELGVEMNAHLFRHFAVMLWLDANPGAYEAAKRLLGHSTLSHTLNMYSGLETSSAIRAFAELVATKRGSR